MNSCLSIFNPTSFFSKGFKSVRDTFSAHPVISCVALGTIAIGASALIQYFNSNNKNFKKSIVNPNSAPSPAPSPAPRPAPPKQEPKPFTYSAGLLEVFREQGRGIEALPSLERELPATYASDLYQYRNLMHGKDIVRFKSTNEKQGLVFHILGKSDRCFSTFLVAVFHPTHTTGDGWIAYMLPRDKLKLQNEGVPVIKMDNTSINYDNLKKLLNNTHEFASIAPCTHTET